jgi:hypothetical protein
MCPIYCRCGVLFLLLATRLCTQRASKQQLILIARRRRHCHHQKFVRLARYYQSDEITVRDKGWASSTHGGEKKCIQVFGRKKKLNEMGLLEYPDDIRADHKESEWEVVSWIHLTQDTDQ